MRIKTITLQKLVKKASKMNINKGIGISAYFYLEGGDGALSIHATDGVNHIKISESENCESINLIVQRELFTKIVEKTTKEYIELEVGDALILKGNGSYKIPIFTGEDYLLPSDEDWDFTKGFGVSTEDLKSIHTINKSSIATSANAGAIAGYLLTPNGVITTDERRICFNDRVVTPGDTILLSKDMVSLFSVIDDLDVVITYVNSQVVVSSPHVTIVGAELSGKEMYPDATALLESIKGDSPTCVVNKNVLSQTLERVALFTASFAKGELVLLPSETKLGFETFEGSYEEINLIKPLDIEDGVEIVINSISLRELINGLSGDNVEIKFIDSQFLLLEQPHVKIILATCGE